MGDIIFIDTGKSVKISFGDKKGDYGFMELEIPKSSTPLIVEEDNVHLAFYSNGDRITVDLNDVDVPADSIDASDLRGKLSDFFFKESVISDSDALMYFNAVIANGGELSITEQNAYNVYRVDSENNSNPWNSNAHIDYPMIGGTVESMVINAQNPGTFDATAVNTVSGDFTANGWTPNDTDSYFKTGLIPSNVLTIESIALEYYSRTNSLNGTNIGSDNSTSQRMQYSIKNVQGNFVCDVYNNLSSRLSVANADSFGCHVYTRISNVDARAFRDGNQLVAITTTGGSQPTVELYIGAMNNSGTPGGFDNKQSASAGVLDGLTVAQAQALSAAKEAFQVTLSRNV